MPVEKEKKAAYMNMSEKIMSQTSMGNQISLVSTLQTNKKRERDT